VTRGSYGDSNEAGLTSVDPIGKTENRNDLKELSCPNATPDLEPKTLVNGTRKNLGSMRSAYRCSSPEPKGGAQCRIDPFGGRLRFGRATIVDQRHTMPSALLVESRLRVGPQGDGFG
jgi:hypothetical protein